MSARPATERRMPAGARVVRLDTTRVDVEEPPAVAMQLPDPASLAAGTVVGVEAVADGPGGLLRRWRKVAVRRATRSTALLVRGYVDLGADGDDAWGVAPAPPTGGDALSSRG